MRFPQSMKQRSAAPVLLIAVLAAAAAATTPTADAAPPAPADYLRALEEAGLTVSSDPAEPRRLYVDYAGRRSDWRITVYLDEGRLFLSALLVELPAPADGDTPPRLGAALARRALERSFALAGYKYALHPDGRRLYLALDLPVVVEPAALVGHLSELAATCEREAGLLLETPPGD